LLTVESHRPPALPVSEQYTAFGGSLHIIVVGHGSASPSQATSQRHEFVHVTAPHAEAPMMPPMQVTSQRPVPQLTGPHAPWLVQLSVQRPEPQVIVFGHALAPVHLRSQSPVVQDRLPHAPAPPPQVWVQLPVVQVRSPHAFAPLHIAVQLPVVQSMSPQAFAPLHSTSHGLALHVMSPHPPVPHVTSHDSPAVHEIESHDPGVGQLMSQCQPVGQVTAPPVPVIVQVVDGRSHESHVLGHSSGASDWRASTRSPTTQ
jgi:hypothetical protein